MNNKRENEEITIDLGKLFKYYIKYWWSFVVSGIAVALIAILATFLFVTPLFKSSVTFYVNNADSKQQIESITSSNLNTSMQLVQTYVNIIKSNTVLNDVINEGELQYTPEQIRRFMTAEQVEETEMFRVSISHPDPNMAMHIVNTIASVAPESISQIVVGSSTKIIDYGEYPMHPYTPNYTKNAVLGGLLGVIIIGIILTLKYLFDMRLTDEDDIAAYFEEPVLGSIPTFELVESRRYSSKSDRRG